MEAAGLNARLRIESEGGHVRWQRLDEGTHSLGSIGADVLLQYPTVSRRHGEIEVKSDRVLYTDYESRNGSWRQIAGENANAVVPNQTFAWRPREKLVIGPFTLTWEHAEGAVEDIRTTYARIGQTYARLLTEAPAHARELICAELESTSGADWILENLHNEFHGNGPLAPFLENTKCREILVNSFDEVYVDLGDGLGPSDAKFLTQTTFEAWVSRTVHAAGRRLDLQNPICEATLPGGARFHAVSPPIAARSMSVAIRRFGSAPVTEQQALDSKWMQPEALALLRKSVLEHRNIVISGGTSTGKTSLLNFLCQYLDMNERVLTVEDTVELSPPVRNLVQLQARSANADGVGQVTLRQLVQCALRMRPDRIIVGECRGAEVLEMLQALNTGHPGSLTTVHANSTDEALQRLELLALLGAPNLSIDCIREWIRASVDVIVQVERDSTGTRRVTKIAIRKESNFVTGYQCAL